MGIFFFINDSLVNLDDPTVMVKDEYHERFARKEFSPFILSEVCVLDMLYMIDDMRDGYYRERLSLKGGFSVRSVVPLADHRFSFDVDFDPNTRGGYTYGDVCDLKADITKYGATRGCRTPVKMTRDDSRLHFIEIGYKKSLGSGHQIKEPPKIEVCKTCRVFENPVSGPINTIIDLGILGLEPPMINHLSLEEQFATKLFVIGSTARQRNQFDAYDSFRIFKCNKMDMKKARNIFETLCERRNTKLHVYASECRHQLDTMLKNTKKREKLEDAAFEGSLDFDAMVNTVKSFYDF